MVERVDAMMVVVAIVLIDLLCFKMGSGEVEGWAVLGGWVALAFGWVFGAVSFLGYL